MTFVLHHQDIPSDVSFGASVAIDTETLGLNPLRDRLCVVQLSAGDGTAHLVKFDGKNYAAPNLKKILSDKNILKIFHFARFDVAVMQHYLGVVTAPVYCTKIASRLARTYTEHHSLKTLCKELAGLDLDKQQQTTNWAAADLSPEQLQYAASDVLHLHKLKEALDSALKREGRLELAKACFDFLPSRAGLDLAGWPEDIFAH